MCGIVGAFPLNKVDLEIDPKLRRQLTLFLHNEILFETIARGKDSTGVSISYGLPDEDLEEDVEKFWMVLKQPVDTIEFFLNDGESNKYHGQDDEANIESMMDVASLIQRPMNHIIGHTRAKTVGSEFNPLNNHPIIVNDIIGIHNGGCKNYKTIYEKHKEMTPMGEVDSEAIIQLIAENAAGRALDESDIKFVTERIVGPRAVIAYNRNHPEKVIYFHDKDRPLELAYIEELGLAIICSERKFFNRAMHVYSRSRLTLKRDLPALTVQWRHVPIDKGGVIDVADAFEGDWEADDLFPLIECADVLDEYDTDSHTHTNYGKHSYVNNQARVNNQNTAPTTPIKKKVPTADVTDVTKYGYDKDNTTHQQGPVEIQSITASAIIDDDSDEDLNISDVYADDDLLKKGIEYVMSAEGRADDSLLLNRHEKDYKSLLAKSLKEEDAAEIVQQLYPDIFGEGYCRGFKAGVEEESGLQEEDTLMELSDRVQELERESITLERKLKEERQKQRKAAAFIANMKAWILGAIITKDLARVEGGGESGYPAELVFDDDIEQFLGTAKGFHKANPEMVRDLFTDRDLNTISDGMVGLSNKVKTEAASDSPNQFAAALAKSLREA